MAGRFYKRISRLTAAALACSATISFTTLLAQEEPPNSPAPPDAPPQPSAQQQASSSSKTTDDKPDLRGEKTQGRRPLLDEFEEARRIFEQMPPEQRQRFRENFQRWKEMPPEERDVMRDREQVRREKMAKEIDDAIKNSGLQLDSDHREVFAMRYAQERRKIEEQLRKEMDAKRQPMMHEMLDRLKKEFGQYLSAASSPSPAASASPSAKP